ncbi:MAG: hypothetical protein AB8G11_09595 [Saprospiraceae bacterium]
MKHYLKQISDFGYTSYIFLDEYNLKYLEFSTTNSLEWHNDFDDKDDLLHVLKNRLKGGFIPILRDEFKENLSKVEKEISEIIKSI